MEEYILSMSGTTDDPPSDLRYLFIIFILLVIAGIISNFAVQFELIIIVLVPIIFIWILETKQDALSDEREELIQNAKELDRKISKLSNSNVEANWEHTAAAIPTPRLFSFRHSATQTRIDELQSNIERRKKILSDIEFLLKSRELVEIHCSHKIPLIQTNKLVEQISQADSELPDSIQTKIILEDSKLTIHAFHELKKANRSLKQIKTRTLINLFTDLSNEPANTEYLQTIAKIMEELVMIEAYQPKIQTIPAIEQLNTAINDPDAISKAESTVHTLYLLMKSTKEIEDFLGEADLTHTSLTTKQCETQIHSAISTSDPSRLDSLIAKIGQIKESSWEQADLYKYDWQSFEHLIGDLWADKGYETTVTVGSNDKGIDVRATDKAGKSEHIIIQVKQYKQGNKVGRPDIQKTLGTLSTDVATRAIVVTSSSFTQPAISEAAKAESRIELIDGVELLNILTKSNMAPPTDNKKSRQSDKYNFQYDCKKPMLEILQEPDIMSDSLKQEQKKSTRENDTPQISSSLEKVNTNQQVSHPFENIVNPKQAVSISDSFGEYCPICAESYSIWETRNRNTNKRYKCSKCSTTWRREFSNGKSLWKTYGGPRPDTKYTLPEWKEIAGLSDET